LTLVGAVAAAVAGSACCVGPLFLAALGVGGAWAGGLAGMARYRFWWTVVAVAFLALAFLRVYGRPRGKIACGPESPCAPGGGRRDRILLWAAAVVVAGLLALPYLASSPDGAASGRGALRSAATGIPAGGGAAPERGAPTRSVTLSVKNMTCPACAEAVRRSLAGVKGVRSVVVTLDPAQAVVNYDPATLRVEQLAEVTAKAGFPSTVLGKGDRR